MSINKVVIVNLALWMLAGWQVLNAHEVEKPRLESPWKGTNVQGGGVLNTGNTQSQSYDFDGLVQYAYKKWLFKEETTYQRESSRSGGTTADKLYSVGRITYSLSDHNFLYFSTDYTRDQFNGYTYIVNSNIGYGRRIRMPKRMTLDLFLGPGARFDELEDTKDNRAFASLQVGATYAWQLTENTKFEEQLESSLAENNIHSFSKSALVTTLTRDWSFSVSYLIENDTKPAEGKEAVNTTTEFNLVYTFA